MDDIKPRTTCCLCVCMYIQLHLLNKHVPLLNFETKFLVHNIIKHHGLKINTLRSSTLLFLKYAHLLLPLLLLSRIS